MHTNTKGPLYWYCLHSLLSLPLVAEQWNCSIQWIIWSSFFSVSFLFPFWLFIFPLCFFSSFLHLVYTHRRERRDVDELLPPCTVASAACCLSAFPVWLTPLFWPRVFWDPATAAGLWTHGLCVNQLLENSLKGVWFCFVVVFRKLVQSGNCKEQTGNL